MRLFYLINSWAGWSEWLDGALRFFYVGAVPLLATALAAMIFLVPRRAEVSRRRVGLAALLSLALCVAFMALVPLFQKQFLGDTPISPRPFMTHWTTPLVVEANDNSFPCYEVMLAAAFATLLWASLPIYGLIAWGAVLLLAFARTFCGMNYLGDSLGGAVVGAALATFSLALMRVRLQLPATKGSTSRLTWRVRHQGAASILAFAGFAVFAFISLMNSPVHGAKFKKLWGNPAANTAFAVETATPAKAKTSAALLPTGIQESEGGTLATSGAGMVTPGQSLLSSKAARLDGHLPQSEIFLAKTLQSLRLPHRIIGVNVAQVKAGNTPYRVAAVRFEVKKTGAIERKLVTQTVVAFFKRAFQADAQLQHLDIVGVKLGEANSLDSGLSETARKARSAHGGARPVFTASIARRDLILKNRPAWTNWEKLEPGMWLRSRSLLYIDPKVLPLAEAQPVIVKPPAPKPPIKKPIVEKPAIKKPLIKKPLVKKPFVKKPLAKPAVKKKPFVRKRAPVRKYRKRFLKKRRYRVRRYRSRRSR